MFWEVLLVTWGLLGNSWKHFERLGEVLGATWVELGASWKSFGVSWRRFGSIMGRLGRVLGDGEGLGRVWGGFGRVLAFLEGQECENRGSKNKVEDKLDFP